MTTKKKEADNVFITSEDVKIRLKPVDPLFVQTITRSVVEPKKPTYTEYIGFNKRPQEVEMRDKETAEQIEGGLERWKEYEEARDNADSERMDRSLKAIFMSGTEVPDNDDWVTDKWLGRMEFLGIPIPESREYAWVLYILTNYNAEEILAISQKIMKLTGLSEEDLAIAEETFQPAVQDGIE